MISNIIDAFYKFTKPFIFQFDPELTHELLASLVQNFGSLLLTYKENPALEQTIFGKKIANPIGLAAGFDKYGTLFSGLSPLGFGFSELGSFTKLPQKGNLKPRIKRFPNKKALLNKMGFNNPGLEMGMVNIEKLLNTSNRNNKIAISLGRGKYIKNEQALLEYESLVDKINLFLEEQPLHGDLFLYVAINISSPNTPGLRQLQRESGLSELVETLKKKSHLPLLVKLSPDFPSSKEFCQCLETASSAGADGFILTNTSINYQLLNEQAQDAKLFQGGLSGLPIASISEKYLIDAYKCLGGDNILIASGGIMNQEDAWRRILRGASLVQVYTGLVYNGPSFINKLQVYIYEQLKKHQISSLTEVMNNRDYLLATITKNIY